jgi:hypothetical protein
VSKNITQSLQDLSRRHCYLCSSYQRQACFMWEVSTLHHFCQSYTEFKEALGNVNLWDWGSHFWSIWPNH